MLNCIYCNEPRKSNFYVKKHEKTCYLNPINSKFCQVCGSIIKNYQHTITCSYACSNKLFRTGPNHGNWKEDSYKTTCFHFHEKKCIVCEECNIVEVHHFDENHDNNTPSNLIPLCPTHHQYIHSRYKELISNKLVEYQKQFICNDTLLC
jgi:hypothetical protein